MTPAVPQALGLYVHVPFCEVKCHYCHFAIDPGLPSRARQERYTAAVLAEMERRGTPRTASGPDPSDTLYFGGGTPSLLAPDGLGAIVAAARSRYGLRAGAEITVEANPRDLDLQGCEALRGIGADRLSLGVQHFDDDVLRAMGRVHRSTDNKASMDAGRRGGFANVSIDLILGWPGETPRRWADNLDRALDMSPDHVSLYVLEVDGRNLLAHQQRTGALHLPEDDLVADLYLATVERLERAGIHRYEISNFSRAGFESRHNAKYWNDAPFLGFGLSAHTYVCGRRSWNEPTFGRYVAAIEGGGLAEAGGQSPTAAEHHAEALFTGLRRTEGISLTGFLERYGIDVLCTFGPHLKDGFEAGLLETRGDRLRLTPRGVLLSNEVFRALI